MIVIDSLSQLREDRTIAAQLAGGSCVAIGKFDGLHLGHQAVLTRLRDAAVAADVPSVVLTFSNHPLSYLRPEDCPKSLMSRDQRIEAFEAAGVDVCVMVAFDHEVATIPAEEFISEVLVGTLHARHIIMGADFRFGYRGAGDGAMLTSCGKQQGFVADVVEWVKDPGNGQVSSSLIRAAIASGDVDAAARMLGRLPAVRGEVVHGDARGRELGFPTANLGGVIEGLVPADGVYAGWVLLQGEQEPRVAAISVGNNPTFTPDAESRVEAFVLDFDSDLYGQRIEVRFAHRLRDMAKVATLEALLELMHADVRQTRELVDGQ